jgi:nucleotide-binding universal stress UspA family protein
LGTAAAVPTLVVPGEPREPEVQAGAFRNILSAVDFSEVSLRALATALDLAQQSGGRLRLLHVLDGLPHAASHAGWDASRLGRTFRALAARMDRELESLIPADALHWSDIEAATVLGPPHDAIVAQASHERADLIVIGLPRRSRLRTLIAGSTAHKVLRRVTAPVLLVPGTPASPAPAAEGVLRLARAASL